MLEAYRKHLEERAQEDVPAKPLDADQTAALVELLKNPPAGEEAFILDLLENRVPAGVDQAAYVKAGFLAAIAKGEAESPLIDKVKAVQLLGTMLGGYNIQPLIAALDEDELAPTAVKALSRSEEHTSELQSHHDLVCRLLLEKKKNKKKKYIDRKSTSLNSQRPTATKTPHNRS